MRTLAIAAATMFLAAPALNASAQQQPHTAAVTTPRCVVTQVEFRDYARAVYKRDKIARKAIKALDRRRACAKSKKASHNMLRFQRRQSDARKARIALNALLPYPGPGGTRWAIPWYIVSCESESSGLWTAANPSGAIGPYQLLGHGAPWPVRTEEDRLEHHRIAARLWNGGRGASQWVCA